MPKSVKFSTENQAATAVFKTFPSGILNVPKSPLGPDSQSNAITSVYFGGSKINATNYGFIYRQIALSLQNGVIAGTEDSIPTQDTQQPTCLEVYTVLNSVLRLQTESTEKLDKGIMHPNDILAFAKRDLNQYRNTDNVLHARIRIQILKVVDYLFLSEATRNLINLEAAHFFLDQALEGIAKSSNSKALLCICLHIFNHVHSPKLIDKIMAQRLLDVMQTQLTGRRSSALCAEYLTTFKSLFKYQKQVMLDQTHLWVPILLKTLFDPSTFIRQQGLTFLQDLLKLGQDAISKEFFGQLSTPQQDDPSKTFAAIAVQQMISLLGVPGEAKQTMNTWASILMLLDSNKLIKLASWKLLSDWLAVPRVGFASRSLSTKDATFSAWEKVIYLFAFRYENKTPIDRNLASLVHPIKPRKQTTVPILDRFKACFNDLLFIALRTCPISTEHLDITWSILIQPCLEAMLQHNSKDMPNLAFEYFMSLISQTHAPRAERSRLLQESPVTLNEVGGIPNSWIRENVQRLFEMLPIIYEFNGFYSFEKCWNALVAIIRQNTNESSLIYEQLLACINFLKRCTFDQEETSTLYTTFLCSFNYEVLIAEKFRLVGPSGEFQVGNGTVSCATLLLSQVVLLKDDHIFNQMLARFSTNLSRQVALVARMVCSNPNDLLLRASGVRQLQKLLKSTNLEHLEDSDTLEVLEVLYSTSSDDLPPYWEPILTSCFSKSNNPEVFMEFVKKYSNDKRYIDLFYSFKKTIFIDVEEFDIVLQKACLEVKPELLDDLSGIPPSFIESLQVSYIQTAQLQFMRKGLALMDTRSIKANAHQFLDAAYASKDGAKIWQLVFCARKIVGGRYPSGFVARVQEAHANGEIEHLPKDVRPGNSPQKRELGQLSPPPTSPLSSPRKRTKVLGSSGSPEPGIMPATLELMSSPPVQPKFDLILLLGYLEPSTLKAATKSMPEREVAHLKRQLEGALAALNEGA